MPSSTRCRPSARSIRSGRCCARRDSIPFVPAEAETQDQELSQRTGSPPPRGRTEIGSMAVQTQIHPALETTDAINILARELVTRVLQPLRDHPGRPDCERSDQDQIVARVMVR